MPLLEIAVPRPGGVGRPSQRPDSLTGDKAYGSKANRATLRQRKIKTVIPQRRDQVANRLRKGSAGGRPPAFDTIQYKHRNQVERGYSRRKQFRALATRYYKLGHHWQATNDIVETLDWIRATPDKSQPDPADRANSRDQARSAAVSDVTAASGTREIRGH